MTPAKYFVRNHNNTLGQALSGSFVRAVSSQLPSPAPDRALFVKFVPSVPFLFSESVYLLHKARVHCVVQVVYFVGVRR